jgi:protein-tyrosine phosphatase
MPADEHPLAAVPAPRDPRKIYEICVVCLGNICRSPMAEALIKAQIADAGLADLVSVQSAGTGDWHLGERMDRGARIELARRGYDGSAHRARQISADWLDDFDLILATDQRNLNNLRLMAAGRPDLTGRITLLRSFDPAAPEGAEVPDPYGGGPEEFTRTFELIEAAARGLVAQLAAMLAGEASG